MFLEFEVPTDIRRVGDDLKFKSKQQMEGTKAKGGHEIDYRDMKSAYLPTPSALQKRTTSSLYDMFFLFCFFAHTVPIGHDFFLASSLALVSSSRFNSGANYSTKFFLISLMVTCFLPLVK